MHNKFKMANLMKMQICCFSHLWHPDLIPYLQQKIQIYVHFLNLKISNNAETETYILLKLGHISTRAWMNFSIQVWELAVLYLQVCVSCDHNYNCTHLISTSNRMMETCRLTNYTGMVAICNQEHFYQRLGDFLQDFLTPIDLYL